MYKRFIKRGKKTFGPYYYSNYRDGDEVKTRYIGKAGPNKFLKLIPALILIGILIYFLAPILTGFTIQGSSEPTSTSEWPMFHRSLNHSGYTSQSGPLTNATLWTFTTADLVRSSPTVANGVVYFGTLDTHTYIYNGVYALNATDGTQIWFNTMSGGGNVDSSPAVVNDIVYAGSNDNSFYALNATNGTEIWNYTTGADVDSSPAVANDIVYIGSLDNNVYALNATTGISIWSYTTGNDILSSPAVANDTVYVGSYDNKIYALNAANGNEIWSYATGDDIYSSPAVAGGVVYIGSADNKIYAFTTLKAISNIISPANNVIDTDGTVTFSCNATGNYSLINTTLYIWNSTGSNIYTNTENITGTFNETSWAYILPYNDNFKWNCLVYENESDNSLAKDWNDINWTVTINVPAGETGGKSGSAPLVLTTCTDQCSGAICDGGNVRECSDTNADGCLEWGSLVSCPSGYICESGSCVKTEEENESQPQPEEEQLLTAPPAGGGGGGSECISDFVCGNWSECNIKYNIEDALSESTLSGEQERVCTDSNGCSPPTIETRECFKKVPVTVEKEVFCLETYLNIYDRITGKLVSRIKQITGSAVNLELGIISEKKCGHCSNGIKDYDEVYADCGGSCNPCSADKYIEWNANLEMEMTFDENTSVEFNVGNETHSIDSAKVADNGVYLEVHSGFNVSLNIGEEKLIDVNDDGVNDISLTLKEIKDKKFIIILRKIPANLPAIQKEKYNVLAVLISAFILLALIIFLLIRKKPAKKGKGLMDFIGRIKMRAEKIEERKSRKLEKHEKRIAELHKELNHVKKRMYEL